MAQRRIGLSGEEVGDRQAVEGDRRIPEFQEVIVSVRAYGFGR